MHDRLAHRHLDLVLSGLRSANPAHVSLPEPAMTLEDLRDMPQTATRRSVPSEGGQA
jgi:hypothetical protein